MYQYYTCRANKNTIKDSTIRALSKALDTSWAISKYLLSMIALDTEDMPNSLSAMDHLLRHSGYRKCVITNDKGDNYTVKKFCRDNPKRTYILMHDTGVVAAVNGDYYDIYDSGDEIVLFFWMKE